MCTCGGVRRERQVEVPRDERELLGVQVVVEVEVLSRTTHVVAVAQQILQRRVACQRIDVDIVGQVRVELSLIGTVEPLQQRDDRLQIRSTESVDLRVLLGIGRLVIALIRKFRVGTCLVQHPVSILDGVGVGVVRRNDQESGGLHRAVHRVRGVREVLGGLPRLRGDRPRHCLVQRRRVRPKRQSGVSLVCPPVAELREIDQERKIFGLIETQRFTEHPHPAGLSGTGGARFSTGLSWQSGLGSDLGTRRSNGTPAARHGAIVGAEGGQSRVAFQPNTDIGDERPIDRDVGGHRFLDALVLEGVFQCLEVTVGDIDRNRVRDSGIEQINRSLDVLGDLGRDHRRIAGYVGTHLCRPEHGRHHYDERHEGGGDLQMLSQCSRKPVNESSPEGCRDRRQVGVRACHDQMSVWSYPVKTDTRCPVLTSLRAAINSPGFFPDFSCAV